jgi:hypothetical protein
MYVRLKNELAGDVTISVLKVDSYFCQLWVSFKGFLSLFLYTILNCNLYYRVEISLLLQ